MCILHMPMRKGDETREEYDSCITASKRIQAEQERDWWTEACRIHKDLEEDAEVEQLQQERENHEIMKRNHDLDHSNQLDLSMIQEHEVVKHHTACRHKHYNSWLSSQIILNSICANNIWVVWGSTIPNHMIMKQPIYPRYPWSEPSDHIGGNATPGPSCPQEQDERQQHYENTHDDRRSHKRDMLQCDTRHTAMGNSPGDPSDGSSQWSHRPPYNHHKGLRAISSVHTWGSSFTQITWHNHEQLQFEIHLQILEGITHRILGTKLLMFTAFHL